MRRQFSAALVAAVFVVAVLAAQDLPRPSLNGTIQGRVLAADGSPATNIRVSAMAIQDVQTGADQALLSLAQTDAMGRYRLENVPPGRYLIMAGFVDAPTYYPGVGAQNQATAITVAPGTEVTVIDFRMVVSAPVRLRGRVIREDLQAGSSTLPIAPNAPIQVRITGGRLPSQVTQVASDGSFEFTSVRPGTYQVTAFGTGIRMLQPAAVTLADKDVTDFVLKVPLIVPVTASTTVQGGGPDPRFTLTFTSVASNPGAAGLLPLNMANAGMLQVPAGEYQVTLSNLPVGYNVASLRSGGVDLNASSLRVTAAGVAPIQITLSVSSPPPWVSLSGRIQGRGLLRDVSVTLASTAVVTPLNPIIYLDGSFEIPKALPGLYTVRAVSVAGIPQNATAAVTVGITGINYVTVVVPPTGPLPTLDVTSTVRVSGTIRGRAKMLPESAVQLIRNGDSMATFSTPVFMDGSFEFLGIPSANYAARIYPPIPGAVDSTVAVGATDLRGLELVVPNTREIPGRVVTDSRTPMPKELTFSVGSVTVPVSIQPDGSFQISGSEGSTLQVAAPSLSTYSVKSITYGNDDLASNPLRFTGKADEEMRVTLNPPGQAYAVSGRITGDLPANTNRVWLTESTGRYRTLETTITTDKRFQFASVPSGAYTVSLVGTGYAASTSTAQVVVSSSNVTNIDLVAPREIRGRVVVTGNAAVPRFSLTVGETSLTVNAGADGLFKAVLPVRETRFGPAAGLPPRYTLTSAEVARAADGVEELTVTLAYR